MLLSCFPKREPDHTIICKLIDFGLSKKNMIEDVGKTKFGEGTPAYMVFMIFFYNHLIQLQSPELSVRGDKKYDRKVDVWSFGMILLELISRKELWGKFQAPEIAKRVRDGDLPPIPKVNSLFSFSFNSCRKLPILCAPSSRPVAHLNPMIVPSLWI